MERGEFCWRARKKLRLRLELRRELWRLFRAVVLGALRMERGEFCWRLREKLRLRLELELRREIRLPLDLAFGRGEFVVVDVVAS